MASYFIDYENVRVNGFQGLESLTQEDKVYIFYTDNADSMTFGLHRRLQESPAQISYIKVAAGRNALDFQLASYLGYRIAQAPEEAYTIVSRDNGFAPLVHFWGEKHMQVEMHASLAKKIAVEEEFTFRGGKKSVSFLGRGRREDRRLLPQPMTEDKQAEEEKREAEKENGGVEIVQAETVDLHFPEETPAETAAAPVQTEKKTQSHGAQPVKAVKAGGRRRGKEALKAPETDSLFETVLDMIAYPDKAQTVWKYVTKYKTKQGLNNALVKTYGSDIAGEIYKSIKPLLADKKAK